MVKAMVIQTIDEKKQRRIRQLRPDRSTAYGAFRYTFYRLAHIDKMELVAERHRQERERERE